MVMMPPLGMIVAAVNTMVTWPAVALFGTASPLDKVRVTPDTAPPAIAVVPVVTPLSLDVEMVKPAVMAN